MFWNILKTLLCIALAFCLARYFALSTDPSDKEEQY
jgi:hypothetical protein